ncbi:nitroreductase family deazaflavin-dependent oxidoreductase [Actinotalea solisilvae]|uniref:nitroreductase family deazaflavin-dependent oxidoreductase n=1 Tax=Actinotalea solisilvae TaxID=2072922 RepID=UPI0018F2200F|nr:nitroreductase family deazaflavin-dependent oxidoreductase [Actinotalea solisilvae]
MDDGTRSALHRSQVIDLTTTGRRTREPRRIEIYLHELDGRLFISGMPFPTKRQWLRNVEADPHVTIHLKRGLTADVPALARVVEDPVERRPLIEAAAARWGRDDVDLMMEQSPLMELTPTDA